VRHPGGNLSPETAVQLRRLIETALRGADLSQPIAVG
jgi:hypothetical protein